MRVLSRLILTSITAICAISASAQPNVVLILADDLGWNDVGYHGSEIRTPTLDALAASGVTFEQYHSQPTCTSTRAALMTGKSPQRLGIYRQFAKYATEGLPTGEQTLADYLKKQSYQTWLVGKWHLGYARQEFHPNSRGFDHFYGHVTGGVGYWDHVHGGGYDWQRNGQTVREDGYTTHLLADEAIKLIKNRAASQPFFLFASFNAPHLPNEAPQNTIDAYGDIQDPLRRIHAAMVTELDTAIGEIVEALKSEGEFDNTLIWFMSDNGGLNRGARPESSMVSISESLEGLFGTPLPFTLLEFIRTNTLDGGSDNSPLRFGKSSVYEGGARVPSLAHRPQTLPAHRAEEFVSAQDVLPTILHAIGADIPEDLDGGTRLAVLENKEAGQPRDYVTTGQLGAQAFYRWPWKLIALDDELELYNLANDPLEENNLANTETDLVEALHASLIDSPRAPSLHIPLYKVFWDPDFFGGTEDRAPWAELTIQNSTN